MPNIVLACGAQDSQIPLRSDGIPWCTCADPDIELLHELMAAGLTQPEASRVLWDGGPTTPAQAVAYVRAHLLVAFPWLRLPEHHTTEMKGAA